MYDVLINLNDSEKIIYLNLEQLEKEKDSKSHDVKKVILLSVSAFRWLPPTGQKSKRRKTNIHRKKSRQVISRLVIYRIKIVTKFHYTICVGIFLREAPPAHPKTKHGEAVIALFCWWCFSSLTVTVLS